MILPYYCLIFESNKNMMLNDSERNLTITLLFMAKTISDRKVPNLTFFEVFKVKF